MIYPENYIKNQKPEFYAELERQVESGNFHILFTGSCGCGKTYLARQIMYYLSGCKDYEYMSYEAAERYSYYKEAAWKKWESDIELLTVTIPSREILCLDDLGNEQISSESKWFFQNLINLHCEAIKNGICTKSVITTNLGTNQLIERYGDRLYDRLCGNYTIFKFKDYSFRQANQKVVTG